MYLIGKESDVEAASLRYRTNKAVFSFDRVLPTPPALSRQDSHGCTKFTDEEKQENIEKYGFPDWYEWRIHNWGTKWDIDPTLVEPTRVQEGDLTYITYTFDTAWSPPDGIAAAISGQNPEVLVVLVFDEPGCDFAGKHTFQQGYLVDRIDISSISYISGLLNGDIGSLYYEYSSFFSPDEELEEE